VNTIQEDAQVGRRRLRRYSREFKAQLVAACQGPGVSIAAIALHHKLNANRLRRWIGQAMSLIQSAKLNGHDPNTYLRDLLARLPTQPASLLEELLPHREQPMSS